MKTLKRKKFERLYAPLEEELVAMARWAAKTGARVLVLFEGRDTAGKGGAIQAVARPLNPRQCRIVALPRPTDREKTQWYFQRYVQHLPTKGEIVLFDRSWYNRAGVERVMGFCSRQEAETFLTTVPIFENLLSHCGFLIFKYYLDVSRREQKRRLRDRREDPLKRWKRSPVDDRAIELFHQALENVMPAVVVMVTGLFGTFLVYNTYLSDRVDAGEPRCAGGLGIPGKAKVRGRTRHTCQMGIHLGQDAILQGQRFQQFKTLAGTL